MYPNMVLLDDNLTPGAASYLFSNPVEIICAHEAKDVSAALSKIEYANLQGHYIAGFFAYELGYLFEDRLCGLLPKALSGPLLWVGVYERVSPMVSGEVDTWLQSQIDEDYCLEYTGATFDRTTYTDLFDRVKDYIAAGDIYQLNLTFKAEFKFNGSPLALYRTLRQRQKVSFGGLISTPEFNILSLSPELFIRIRGRIIEGRPMKGTAPRGKDFIDDENLKNWLKNDEKSRAENLMILDLLRNDFSRVSEIGSVHVPDMYTIETYSTLHQMTSGVQAKLKPGTGLHHIIHSLFPCGSITGAPKIRAMEIIRELEPAPRGIYTGAIGMISPNGDMCFNVAIRTAVVSADGTGEIGIGSGLVSDSKADDEYEECLLKMKFLMP